VFRELLDGPGQRDGGAEGAAVAPKADATGMSGSAAPASFKHAIKARLASERAWPILSRVLRPTCLVLAYHRIGDAGDPYPHVEADVFRCQMEWLRRHCAPIGHRDLPRAIGGAFGRRTPVLVTFDDGYRDYAERAYPVLRELGIPALNFLPTQFIDDGALFWWDAINLAADRSTRRTVRVPWSGEAIALDAVGRRSIARRAKDRLKLLMHDEMDAEVAQILDALGFTMADLATERHVMTWEQIRATCDVTTYGGHLHTHPLMSRIGLDRLEHEIATCRARIEAETGARPTVFAYPDGNVVEAAKPILRRYGFDLAFSIREGIVGPDVDWMEILRYPGPPTLGDLAWRIARVSGVRRTPRTISGS
jgi:peptidoglycan/xylan/chitin deacetylase (PgdA/CDA1 family)